MGRFENKKVLVTGGSAGIGLATAQAFAREGARVVITGRDETALGAAKKEIGNNALAVRVDVSNLNDIDMLFQLLKKEFGSLDSVFVNAGGAQGVPIEKITEEKFDFVMSANLKGAFFTAQKAVIIDD